MKKLLIGIIFGIVLTLSFQFQQKNDYKIPNDWQETLDKFIPRTQDDPKVIQKSSDKSHNYTGQTIFNRKLTILKNIGYTVSYDEIRENPAWVCCRLISITYPVSPKRPSKFSMDTLTIAKVTHNDYTHSGYDRGHMAPNYAIATRYGQEAQKETFLMSNIVPQLGNLN